LRYASDPMIGRDPIDTIQGSPGRGSKLVKEQGEQATRVCV
jgi:hypothetical protein